MSESVPDPAGAIAARLDRLPPSWAAWRIVVLLSLGGCFEFYDLLMTGYISPGLTRAGIFRADGGLFGLSDQAAFTAANFLGLWIGTLAFAWVADRFGRRAIFTGSLLWYSAATAVMACQSSAFGVDLWRLIAGIGLGVEMITIDTYVVEFTPKAIRGRAFAVSQSIQFCAVPIVAFMCWWLLPLQPLGIEGWRWVMLAGAAGAIFIWWIRRGVPESPRWLARHGRFAEADAVVAAIEARAVAETGKALAEPVPVALDGAGRGSFSEILRPPYRKRTILLAVFNAFQAIGFYGFGNWVPNLLAAQGAGVMKSQLYAFAIALAYPVGPLICSLFADRFERKWQIVAAAIGTATLGLLFATQSAPVALIALGVGITLSNNLLSYSYHAYQAELFPTRIRARAVGFVYSFSRLSTVFTSFMIAFFLRDFGTVGVFAFIAFAMGMVVLSIGLFGPPTGKRSLEEISR